jgi:hypothetical protein
MALGTLVFPASIDNDATMGPTTGIIPGTTSLSAVGTNQGDQLGITRNLINALIALENKVGINGSTVTTTLEYRVRKIPFKIWVAGLEFSPPATLNATFTSRNSRPVLAFTDSATWSTLFFNIVPLGSILTSGVIIRLYWMGATAVTGNVIWSVAIERMNTDQDLDSFDTAGTATTTTNGTAGILTTTSITLTNIDSMVPGDPFALRVQRTGGTMVGDAQLQFVSIESV